MAFVSVKGRPGLHAVEILNTGAVPLQYWVNIESLCRRRMHLSLHSLLC